MEHYISNKLKKMKENILKKVHKAKLFFARMDEEPLKFYTHYYGYISSKVQSHNNASNDQSQS